MAKIDSWKADFGGRIFNVEGSVVISIYIFDCFKDLCKFYNYGNYSTVLNSVNKIYLD